MKRARNFTLEYFYKVDQIKDIAIQTVKSD